MFAFGSHLVRVKEFKWTAGPEANHATVLALKPILDVQEMTNGLESEPFKFFRSHCQGMPLQGQHRIVGVCVWLTPAKAENVSLLSRIKSPFSGPRIVLVLTGIRRSVVQIKAIEKDDLIPF